MRRWMRLTALLLATLLLGGCGAGPGSAEGADVALFAVNVGKGDALVLKAGNWVGLIDAGKARAMGRVRASLKGLGVDHLNAVFLTHTDDDHAEGLSWLAESDIAVDAWYASAMYAGVKEKKHPAVLAAALRGQEVGWLRRGDSLSLGDSGATLKVLAPASYYDDDEDDNSLVMMLESGQGKILLTGDMELPEESELMTLGDDLKCDVLKVGNHADSDTTSEAFARAASAKLALISTDSLEKPGTPDTGVVARLMAAGSSVAVTQDAGLGLLVKLKGGEPSVQSVDIDAAPVTGLSVTDVDAEDDRIVLASSAGKAIDLEGFYLYSDRGDELFVFPEGASIAPGGRLILGTNSTDGDFDLLWDDKKVVHKKKTDVFTLYDPYGRAVDSLSNGL